MELSLLLIQQIGSMFIMMLLGVILVKLKVLKSEHGTVISKILLYIVVPCSIIKSFEIDFTVEKLQGLGLSVLGALTVNVVFMIFERILRRPLKLSPVEGASVIYSNAGNLVIPLVYACLGTEWVFYTSGYLLIEQILLWTHGKNMVSGEHDLSFRKIITNVNILAILAGVIIFFTGFKPPVVVQSAIDSMTNLLAPMSMILTGMLLGSMKFIEILKKKRAYMITAIRLVLFPLIMISLIALCGVTRIHPDAADIFLVTSLTCSSAVATTITQFAQLYNKEPEYSSVISIMSVLFCIITIPLMVGYYQWII